MMRSFRLNGCQILLILSYFLFVGFSARAEPGYRVKMFALPGTQKTMVTIRSVENSESAVQTTIGKVVIKKFHDWKFKKFKELYPEVHAPVMETMSKESDFDKGLIGLVLVFEGNDFSNIQGSLAFYEGDKLPTEAMFKVKFSRSKLKPSSGESGPVKKWNAEEKKYVPQISSWNNTYREGVIEVSGGFNIGQEDLFPLLYFEAEREGISTPVKHKEIQLPDGSRRIVTVFPEKYVASTHQRNEARFTQSWGFHRNTKMGEVGGSVFLEMDRDGWIKLGNGHFNTRRGIVELPKREVYKRFAYIRHEEIDKKLIKFFGQPTMCPEILELLSIPER